MKEIRLPAKADFAPMETAYLDSATTHPTSLGANPVRGERDASYV